MQMLGVRTLECIMREADAVPIIGSGKCSSNSCILDFCLWHRTPLSSLMGRPYTVNYSWGSSKPNAIFPSKSPKCFVFIYEAVIF